MGHCTSGEGGRRDGKQAPSHKRKVPTTKVNTSETAARACNFEMGHASVFLRKQSGQKKDLRQSALLTRKFLRILKSISVR